MKAKELQLVTLEQAKKLKKLGFNWETEEHYCGSFMQLQVGQKLDRNSDPLRTNYSCPSVALALKWVRDTKGLFGCVFFAIEHFRKGYYWNYFSFEDKNIFGKTANLVGNYEEAESALLDEMLSLFRKGETTMKELSREQKLRVLKEVIDEYNGGFLCGLIARKSYFLGYITSSECGRASNAVIAKELIPELLQFKPKGCTINNSWFNGADPVGKRLGLNADEADSRTGNHGLLPFVKYSYAAFCTHQHRRCSFGMVDVPQL
jgi:hypothetical protein